MIPLQTKKTKALLNDFLFFHSLRKSFKPEVEFEQYKQHTNLELGHKKRDQRYQGARL